MKGNSFHDLSVGTELRFGRYKVLPWIEDEGTVKEPIVWHVVDVDRDAGEATLVSEAVLGRELFGGSNDWSTSTVRSWLKSCFVAWFSDEERNHILETKRAVSQNPITHEKGCDSTSDHLYLLSVEEALEYFDFGGIRSRRSFSPVAKIKYRDADSENCWTSDEERWWLCTPGSEGREYCDCVIAVDFEGKLDIQGQPCLAQLGVRPAMKVRCSFEKDQRIEGVLLWDEVSGFPYIDEAITSFYDEEDDIPFR